MAEPDDEIMVIVVDPRPRDVKMVPDSATAWLENEVAAIIEAPSSEAASRIGILGRAIGLCEPLVETYGEAAGMDLATRQEFRDRNTLEDLLSCGCEGVDLDAIDAYRRLVAIHDVQHRYRQLPFPLTKSPDAPTIVFPEDATGQQLIDRISKLSDAEREGFRIVFHGPSWTERDWR